jgi:hypothetical protein
MFEGRNATFATTANRVVSQMASPAAVLILYWLGRRAMTDQEQVCFWLMMVSGIFLSWAEYRRLLEKEAAKAKA